MKINFEELKQVNIDNMNCGNGTVKSKMFMNRDEDLILLDITAEK